MRRLILASVVEGHGEESAFRVLLQRLGPHIDPNIALDVKKPWRLPKTKMKKPGELRQASRSALELAGEDARLIVLLDADDDCPAELGPELLNREFDWVRPASAAVVIAKSEYESWFVACADSLSRKGKMRTVPGDSVPVNPESIRDAKKWIGNCMHGGNYSPTRDQASLSAALDIELARSRSDSFDKLCREVQRLLTS